MSHTNLLTIAMPVYERTEYFLKALDSALNQTVACKVIVVDNCSSHDFFERICAEKGVEYFRNEKNIGLFPNWNHCFECADSEYVMILGDDDILDPTYVESFLNAKKKYPEIDIFFSDFVLNNLTIGQEESHKHVLPFGYIENGNRIIEYGIRYKLGYPLITSSVRKSKFTGFYSEFHASNDWLWIYSNAKGMTFYGESKKLCKYGIHENQDSSKSYANCLLSKAYILEEVLYEFAKSNFLEKRLKASIFWTLVWLKSNARKQDIKRNIQLDNIYSKYLEKKLNEDFMIRLIYLLPRWVVSFLFRSFRKMGFTK